MPETLYTSHLEIKPTEDSTGSILELVDAAARNDIVQIRKNLSSTYNAIYYGISPSNDALTNSQNLQALMDELTTTGGTIYIPGGVYKFASNVTTEFGDACVTLKSNVNIVGDGATTILKPQGNLPNGLDMFYYNGVTYSGATYLENCLYEAFTIDGEEACLTGTYSAFGKGFMAVPIRNCHWKRVIVKNTDATGIGVDCPVNCTIMDCKTYNCGKAGTVRCNGASGIGIGHGYDGNESMVIANCQCQKNKMFGIFFEHQNRFNPSLYKGDTNQGFIVSNCVCWENNYNFGGLKADNVKYINCISSISNEHGYFFENCTRATCNCCESDSEGKWSGKTGSTSYVSLAGPDTVNDETVDSSYVSFVNCVSKNTNYGAKFVNTSGAKMGNNVLKDCVFMQTKTNAVMTSGAQQSLILHGNVSDGAGNNLSGTITTLTNKNNTWN